MATLIPAIGSCVSRMTSGEKRFAYRLEDKLEDDYYAGMTSPLASVPSIRKLMGTDNY